MSKVTWTMQEVAVPEHESFYFGLRICASCFSSLHRGRWTRVLKRPIFEDVKETKVLIPSGRQSFCWDCLEDVKREERAR